MSQIRDMWLSINEISVRSDMVIVLHSDIAVGIANERL